MSLGSLILISAPSGAGKTSLVDALIKAANNSENEKLCVSISHTTRPMRPGEIDASNYHFVSSKVFAQMVRKQNFWNMPKFLAIITVRPKHGLMSACSKAAM